MDDLRTGPQLCRMIERRLRCCAQYEYCDAHGRRLPEYAAEHVRVRVYHYGDMNRALVEPLAIALTEMDGCLSAERITNHPILRPQVVAIFARLR